MKLESNVPGFHSRWLISGQLRTLGPLHVGDGDAAKLGGRDAAMLEAREVLYQTVCLDHAGRAMIPGSAIKGVLRAYIDRWDGASTDGDWEQLFGSKDSGAVGAVGGVLETHDARLSEAQAAPQFPPRMADHERWEPTLEQTGAPAYWNAARGTGVTVSVSIDPRTRTAKEQLLYHVEYVPAGQCFTLTLSAENLSELQVQKLLWLVRQFNAAAQPITVGGQSSNGWGRVEWVLQSVARFGEEDLKAWLDDPKPAYQSCKPLDATRMNQLAQWSPEFAANTDDLALRHPANQFQITANFDAPLLVRDSYQMERLAQAKVQRNQQKKARGDKPPSTQTQQNAEKQLMLPAGAPALDSQGFPTIPAKAVRGVLRAQAARILRTLGYEIPEPSAVSPVSSLEEVRTLDLVSQLFGAPGWKAPLRFSAWTWPDSKKKPQWHQQEFLAIDRMTGGGVDGRKFSALAALNPTLAGTLEVDWARLALCNTEGRKADVAGLGLLALVLRDLAEGDLAFGSGAAKGFGSCTAQVVPDANAETARLDFKPWFECSDVRQAIQVLLEGVTPTPMFPANATVQIAAPSTPNSTAKTNAAAKSPSHSPSGSFLNPYHFVPILKNNGPGSLPLQVGRDGSRRPEPWPAHLGHDQYVPQTERDSARPCYSGRLVCKLSVVEVLAIGNGQSGGLKGDKATDGQARVLELFQLGNEWALPGSSLRGMLSAILEAATNSAMRVMENRALSLSAGAGKNRKDLGNVFDYVEAISPELAPLTWGDRRSQLSLAEQLFGAVEEVPEKGQAGNIAVFALASRIRIANGLPFREGAIRQADNAVITPILDSPKGRYGSFYFRPDDNINGAHIPKLSLNSQRHVSQGRKVYLHRHELHSKDWQTADPRDRANQKTRVKPLTGGDFVFHIDFDNLTELELGALCYAIEPNKAFHHKLGMGKPLGMGKVKVRPIGLFLVDRLRRYSLAADRGDLPDSRYHQVWTAGSASVPARYATEFGAVTAQAGSSPAAPSPETLRASFQAAALEQCKGLAGVWGAIEFLGNPGLLPTAEHAPVQYPPAFKSQGEEGKGYEWFSKNEERSKQFLQPLTADNTSGFTQWPLLQRDSAKPSGAKLDGRASKDGSGRGRSGGPAYGRPASPVSVPPVTQGAPLVPVAPAGGLKAWSQPLPCLCEGQSKAGNWNFKVLNGAMYEKGTLHKDAFKPADIELKNGEIYEMIVYPHVRNTYQFRFPDDPAAAPPST